MSISISGRKFETEIINGELRVVYTKAEANAWKQALKERGMTLTGTSKQLTFSDGKPVSSSYLSTILKNCNSLQPRTLKQLLEIIDNGKPIKKVFRVPTPEEVEEYAKSIDFKVNGQYFVDYYDARGWKIKSNKIKDWKACVRTWAQNSKNWTEAEKEISDNVMKKVDEITEKVARLSSEFAKLKEEQDMDKRTLVDLSYEVRKMKIKKNGTMEQTEEVRPEKVRKVKVAFKKSVYESAKLEAEKSGISFKEYVSKAVEEFIGFDKWYQKLENGTSIITASKERVANG